MAGCSFQGGFGKREMFPRPKPRGPRPLSLMDQLAQSAKFKQLRENVAPVDDEEEEVRDVLLLC